MKYARLCEHDRFNAHMLTPEYVRTGEYVPRDEYEHCTGGTLFEVDWTAAYRAGEHLDNGGGGTSFEHWVEDIVNAALGLDE
jgi:hypothetical protein